MTAVKAENALRKKNIQTKSTPYANPTKNSKKPREIFPMAARPPGQWPRSALGYTARRCGEAGSALGVKGLRKPFTVRVGQRSPRWGAKRVVAVSDRLLLPFKRPDRLDVIGPADHSRLLGWMMTIRSASHRVYRQLIVSWSNAITRD